MLDISLRASRAINTLTAAGRRSAAGGLRISLSRSRERSAEFALALMDRPAAGDEVVTGDLGSRVFLDRVTARCLTGQVLDVQPDSAGKFRFIVHRKS